MGLQFQARHANLVAYLTTRSAVAPECTNEELIGFAQGICAPGALIAGRARESEVWISSIRGAAEAASDGLFFGELQAISSEECAKRLAQLKRLFADFRLVAMLLSPPGQPEWGWHDFMRHVAEDSGKHGLALMPVGHSGPMSISHPFPALQSMADCAYTLPAVAFWTPGGEACTLDLRRAGEFYSRQLKHTLAESGQTERLIRDERKAQQSPKLLHISDLHIGKSNLKERVDYLAGFIRNVLIRDRGIRQIAITGDLMDSASQACFDDARKFVADLENATGRPVLAIPGNHDVCTYIGNQIYGAGGNRTYSDQLFGPSATARVVPDPATNCVFALVDSNEAANFARGGVSSEQRLRLAATLDEIHALKPETRDMVHVALVHHHPIGRTEIKTLSPFELFRQKFYDRTCSFSGGDDFVDWCSERGIKVILHGHEHYPMLWHSNKAPEGRQLTSVVYGCGSSTGADGSPMRYAEIALNTQSKKLSILSFRSKSLDGRGFVAEDDVTADHVEIGHPGS